MKLLLTVEHHTFNRNSVLLPPGWFLNSSCFRADVNLEVKEIGGEGEAVGRFVSAQEFFAAFSKTG